MKLIATIILLCLAACGSNVNYDTRTNILSPDQIKINDKVKIIERKYAEAPNQMSKDAVSKEGLDSLTKFIIDSMNYQIHNARVKLTELKISPYAYRFAFTAKFKDELLNEYWMEFDHDTEKQINESYHYKLLKALPENKDTSLSFFFLADMDWGLVSTTPGKYRMRVVPFPKNFNFDSAKVANNKKK